MPTWKPLNLLPEYPVEVLKQFFRVGFILVIRLTELKFLFYIHCEVLASDLEMGMGDPSRHSPVDSCECVSWGALGRTAVSLVGASQCLFIRRVSEGSTGCLNHTDMGVLCNCCSVVAFLNVQLNFLPCRTLCLFNSNLFCLKKSQTKCSLGSCCLLCFQPLGK